MSVAANPALWSSPLLKVALENVKFYYYDVWNIYGDPRVTDYPFMDGGPWATIVMICMYLYVVKIWGPDMMKNRRPYDMRNVILFYNVTLVIVNGWLHWKGTWITNFGLDSWKCQAVDRTSTSEIDLYKIKLGWLFYMTKTIDFCDTFFFVLRKKDRQISGLHVFHHSCMPFFCWIGLKFTPGGNNAFFPWLNSGVHTIMYSYYALSTFSSLRPYLWWKKYITQMQMIQFVAVIIHSFYSMLSPGCQWPKMFIYLSIFNAFIFFCMFYSFFQKTYHSSSKNCGSTDKSHQQHQYSSVANLKSNEKSSSNNSSPSSSLYQQSTSSKLNGTNPLTCPKNRFTDGRFNYYLLSYIFQVCKPNHVNNHNDDINNCSTDKSDAAGKKSQQSAKKLSSSSVSANSSSTSSKRPYRQDDDKSAHQLILNNVCISSTSTTTITATSRSLCADPKCVKCK